MTDYHYRVALSTELGPRYGSIHLEIHGNQINGKLIMLEQITPCYGELTARNICQLHGKIHTFLQEIPYIATGYLDAENLHLIVQQPGGLFELTGVGEGEPKR